MTKAMKVVVGQQDAQCCEASSTELQEWTLGDGDTWPAQGGGGSPSMRCPPQEASGVGGGGTHLAPTLV